MRDQRPTRGGLLTAAATLFIALPATACRPDGPVVLGVSTSATYADAARLAIEDALGEGAIPGLDTILIGAGSNESAPAIRAAETLLSTEGIAAVLGHSNSAASLAAAPLYNGRRVVQISPTATAVSYSRAGPFSFRLAPPDDRQGAFLARYLAETLPGGGRLVLFYVNDDYGRGLRRAFTERLDLDRFQVELEVPHTETEIVEGDIEHTRRTLARTDPDVVVWLARGTVLGRYLPAIRAGAPDALIVGSDAVASITTEGGSEDLRAGVRYVGFVDLASTEPLRTFAARFERRFGAPATGPHVLTYDAAALLLQAIRSGARDGGAIREHLLSLGRNRPAFVGLAGPVSFDEQGDVERSYVMLALPETAR